jgi:hypothetical protein
MIIRSLSRKTASFRQLYNYINRDQTIPYSILWNLNTHNPYHQKKILEQFYENSALLAKGKRRNFLYHDIISVTLQSDVPMDHQMQALRDIALKYIQGRGSNLLAYGRMHLEGKNLHIHLMLSANELEQEKRHYLSKSAFADVQKQCEQYMQQRYPELKQPVIFCKERTEKPNKTRQREYEYSKRTGKKTKKQQVKEMLADLLEQERSQPLKSYLNDHDFELYQRGKHIGVIYDGTKYRLGTLGLREAYAESLSRPVKAQSSPVKEENRPDISSSETPQNETRTQSNMNKIYEEMKKQQERMLEEECEKRITACERELNEALKLYFPNHEFKVYRELNSICVEMFGEHRSIHFSTEEMQDFICLRSKEERDENRHVAITRQMYALIDSLDIVRSELEEEGKQYKSEQQKPVERVDRSQEQDEPELGF